MNRVSEPPSRRCAMRREKGEPGGEDLPVVENRPRVSACSRAGNGFTLIELMIVIVILGILASIAINLTIRLLERGYVDLVKSDLAMAYKASVVFHQDNPENIVTLDDLKKHGYVQSAGVTLTIDDGTAGNLKIRAMHPGVTVAHYVDKNGKLLKQ